MTDNPIAEAFTAVVMGMLTSFLMPAFYDVFDALEAPLTFKIVWALIPLVEFIAGLGNAVVFGLLYSISLIGFGFYLNECGSVIMGIIGLGAYIAGKVIKGSW